MSPLAPLTPLDEALAASLAPKVSRSFSVSSSMSSTSSSSAYSRSADDMLDRLAAQEAHSTIHLWSAGNVRLNGRDLTIPAIEAFELVEAIKMDDRFQVVSIVHFDDDGQDWKVSVRRTPPSTPVLSDVE